jgi:RNA polymerase sigma-70 factor (ECF subfamily)
MELVAERFFGGLVNGPLVLDRLSWVVTAGSERLQQPGEDSFEQRAIDAVKGGDSSAYDYLVSKYMKRVVSIAWGIVRNAHDAEDLAQEAFVKAYQTIGRFKTGQPFGPWIYRIVTNLALDVVKHRKRFRHEELRDVEPAARRDEADLPARSGELAVRIDAAIESLPEMQRVVARLYLVEEFGHAEIAEMTGLSEGTVRSHLSLARGKLKERLSDLHGDSHE